MDNGNKEIVLRTARNLIKEDEHLISKEVLIRRVYASQTSWHTGAQSSVELDEVRTIVNFHWKTIEGEMLAKKANMIAANVGYILEYAIREQVDISGFFIDLGQMALHAATAARLAEAQPANARKSQEQVGKLLEHLEGRGSNLSKTGE